MPEIFSTIRLMFLLGSGLLLALMILLALPNSKLKELVQPFVGWAISALSVVYIFSPIDVLPDPIPVVGWIDDVVALFVAVASAWAAMHPGEKKQIR